MKDSGRYHVKFDDSGQITISKKMAMALKFKHTEKLLLDYDEETNVLQITPLNRE
jgi:bifunctional DNA-binding transcriptional regulator/antitoxin component of YhaV-PrlF toxin-antitoxin module